ncbi:methyl-accepting chemotaxis protein [Psychromonas sp. SR45-3]|uniref:methyl-accepting chemotaxis protein n=1 Tax=Psychromonas sp. SR45-3 TaxID=2760930 RepID=UPI0015FB71C7|nr:methyl-accepting chemotaxis protein [Psychromonas sp. SR45-3]MBB1274759.1 methyl-accepting chemotaxis protein [Psychromonas sp. SR45-3]
MHISLIQRIIIGFSIVIALVIAISGSAYLSQVKMAQQLELTSSTLTSLLDKSNTVLLNLQDANRALMEHANTQTPEKRKVLRDKYFAAKDKYIALLASLQVDLADYPEILASTQQADISAQQLFANAEAHLDLHDSRITARKKALSESGNLNDTWDFFEEDIANIALTAEENGQIFTVESIKGAVSLSSKAIKVLQRSLALATNESAQRFEKDLLQYYQAFKEQITTVISDMPDYAADINYYNGELERAITKPLGLFQQQRIFIKYNEKSHLIFEENAQNMDQVNDQLNSLSGGIRILSGNALSDAEEAFNRSLTLNLVLAFISIIIALTIATTVVRAIRKPLADIIKALNRLSEGDLTENINTQYHSEMGLVANNINALIDKQGKLIYKVQSGATTINAVAAESLAMSEQTNQNVSAQGAQTDIVSTAVTELEAAVYEVASHASNTSNEVTKVTQQAEANMENMNVNLEFINSLKSSLDNASHVIQQLSSESIQIGEVLNVIQGIAEQTNLLALNAAIEAARAGEHGRGFAVVADEVRSLATRSQHSATEINQMIDSLQSKASEAVSIVESNLEYADRSVNQTLATSTSLKEMLLSLNTINDMSTSIATASEEQSAVVKEVAQNIVNIADMANDIALGAEKAAKSSVSLNELSNEQSLLVAQFKLSDDQKS